MTTAWSHPAADFDKYLANGRRIVNLRRVSHLISSVAMASRMHRSDAVDGESVERDDHQIWSALMTSMHLHSALGRCNR